MSAPASKLHLAAFVLYLLTWVATAAPKAGRTSGSAVFFPVTGNVYPMGYFYVTLSLGQPPNNYYLDIDTGSDLTWVQCDAPCQKCTPAPNGLYKPKGSQVPCKDPICASVQVPGGIKCPNPNEKCEYRIEYADSGSSTGVLVKDSVPLKLINGSIVAPQLVFGCGYNQQVKDPTHLSNTDGVLGLGPGSSSILTQLRKMGVMQNVVGHCLSGQGGGFLFFGGDFIPSSGIVWKPMLRLANHYSLGPLDVQFGDQASTNIKGLQVIFDTGSSYTYFRSQAYETLLSLIKRDLVGKGLSVTNEDNTLPVCWKGPNPFKTVRDANSYFKPLALRFTDNAQFQLRPESYLIVSNKGNVCLGIMNSKNNGLGDLNLIGDISLQDKLVIYDNERQLIGWAPANCNRRVKS